MEDRDRPLWSLNAGELSPAYANGLSPRSVIDATLARIRDINPGQNRDWPLLAFAREYEGRLFVYRWPPRLG